MNEARASRARAGQPTTTDKRGRAERALLRALKRKLPTLEALLASVNDHWGYEDRVYRFYHQSFKVYRTQDVTLEIVRVLRTLAPKAKLNDWFLEIVADGTGKRFDMSHNKRWLVETRPILEAFFHARFFLDMACRYGRELKEPAEILPSGWATFLYLYGLR